MKLNFKNIFNRYPLPKAVVLMYHRVAQTRSDIWDITVRPENFEQQLQVLQQSGSVFPLQELIESIKCKTLKSNSIAITFDDGYEDNYTVAAPLLSKYNLPATFFIASGNIEKEAVFWWDELEEIILLAHKLPSHFKMLVNGNLIEAHLEEELDPGNEQLTKVSTWKAYNTPPPTTRCKLFLRLWQELKKMHAPEQQKYLQHIRNWANYTVHVHSDFRTMTAVQLKELSRNKLFTIGSHTVSHLALADQTEQVQENELTENKAYLEAITGNEITMLSYPYGNYDKKTIRTASAKGFKTAFTTEAKPVSNQSNPFASGRFQVKNWNGNQFKNHLEHWCSLNYTKS